MRYNYASAAALAFSLISYLTIYAGRGAGETVLPGPGGAIPPAPAYEASADGDSIAAVANDSLDLEKDYRELEGLVVTATRKLVQSDGAKLTYNVTEDPESGSSNVLDILRKVPGVTVDAEDNVRVNGQTNFRILKNGHEDPMFSGDIKTILKSLPAASIKKIEVISEPGAKYDAEGSAGILNIVTDNKVDFSGFQTRLGAWINGYQVGGNVNFRTKIRKVMLDANVNYNNGKYARRNQITHKTQEDLTGNPDHLLETKSRGRNGWDYAGGSVYMSWEPDTLNLFTLSAYYGHNTWGGPGTNTRTMYGLDGEERWRLERRNDGEGIWDGVGGQASYQHTFREDHNLVVSYLFSFATMDNKTVYETLYQSPGLGETPYIRENNDGLNRSHILQIDYINRFNPKHMLEAGFKGSLYHSSSDRYGLYGEDKATAVKEESSSVDMAQLKDIYALYASYTGTFGKFNAKAGLRYEYTLLGLRYHKGDYPDFTSHLNDLVPNAALSYNFTPASSLRLAYQMRISRPDLWNLNPYRDYSVPGAVSYGNPDLDSEKSHNLSIGYNNYDNKLSGGAKFTWTYISNSPIDIVFAGADGLINYTYANVGVHHGLRLDLNADWNITNALRWSVYASGTWRYEHADSEMLKATKCGWQANVTTNINYTMPCKVRLSAYGGFWTPWMDIQSRGTTNGYYYGLGASRSFLKDDALTVQLSASSFLPWYRHSGWEQKSETVKIASHSRYQQWNFGLSISYKIGGLTAGVKKTVAEVENEGGENRGGGGNK